MPWFISVAFAVIICGVAFLIGRAMRREAEPGSPEADRGLIVTVAAIIVFVLWVGAHTALTALKPIEAGSVGVVYQFGEIVGQKGEGLQFIAPWQDLRTESIKVQRKRFDNVSGFSRETQDVIVSTTLNYRVDPAAVQNLYRTVGPNWFDTLVEPRINQFFKAETVKYDTVDIAPNREQIRLDVQEKLDADLRQFSITVEDLLIDNIDFTPAFKQSIEEKQITAQNALREEERIRQIQNEAQQVEERAKGQRAEREGTRGWRCGGQAHPRPGRCGCHPSPRRGLSRAQHGPHAGGPSVLRRGQALSQRQHRPHPQRSGGHH